MLFAEIELQFLPPLSLAALAALLAALAVGAWGLGWWLGPTNPLTRKVGLWMLRGVIVGLVTLVIFNPVRVQKTRGNSQRPEIFYLLDTSASMQMGEPQTRWEQTLALIQGAEAERVDASAIVKPFRFGERLAAIDAHRPAKAAVAAKQPTATVVTNVSVSANNETSGKTDERFAFLPDDSDTRLQAALKQISTRFGRVPPQGMVVFSDGRIHDEAGLLQVAKDFGKLRVPIHVAPIGNALEAGDVAIAAVIVPPHVRKYSEVEVQVFLRSYGLSGKRTEVKVVDLGANGKENRTLVSLPVTLTNGFQPVSLSFRTEDAARQLRIEVPPFAKEVSERNNRLDTKLAIDRTKLRVLYIEGTDRPLRFAAAGQVTTVLGPFSELQKALIDDDDVECVTLGSSSPDGRLMRFGAMTQTEYRHAFPQTEAQLAAFDAIILSNIAAESFTETELGWIEEWVRVRGGGLCMLGGEKSFASGGWNKTKLADALPIEMREEGPDWVQGQEVRVLPQLTETESHPVWDLVADKNVNLKLVGQFPTFQAANRWEGVRPNLTEVLASMNLPTASQGVTGASSGELPGESGAIPAVVAGRYGRGRTFAAAFPIATTSADKLQKWGVGDNRYYAKFCRNLVYWLTETSAMGRRRLVVTADKRFYRPGDTITLQAVAYDEFAVPTRNYQVLAAVEPSKSQAEEAESDASPIRWPAGISRSGGETDPHVLWGEELEVPQTGSEERPLHTITLPLSDILTSGTTSQSLHMEWTAYEDGAQVDSTSLELQILHDPLEQQNPFPNHALLEAVAAESGGKVIHTPEELAEILRDVPLDVGPPTLRKTPLWSNAWLLGAILGLLTWEWSWRRKMGMA